ncbi:DNA-binding response regulator [Schaalia georgiae]|nr:DNA-binding response regulator [Schaalia georgiae]
MVRIAVVEDEAASRALLSDYIRRYGDEHGFRFDVTHFEDGAALIGDYKPVYDIILMDIQMEHVDGMSAARAIREVDQEAILVFVTSAPQFAINGYQVGALSYLLKPLPWFAFSQELDRCLEALAKRQGASVLLQSGAATHRVPVADIVYVESIKHRLTVHTTGGAAISMVSTLKAMEARLEGMDFFRSNSCYLVSLRHVRGVADQECLMTNGDRLRVSRPRKKAFMSALAAYAGGIR